MGLLTIKLDAPRHVEAICHQIEILQILRQDTGIFLQAKVRVEAREAKEAGGENGLHNFPLVPLEKSWPANCPSSQP